MTASLPPPTVRQSSSDCRPLPDRVALPSRSLASMAYDHDQAILQIEFRGGTVYQYFHVPRETYQDLLQAGLQRRVFQPTHSQFPPCSPSSGCIVRTLSPSPSLLLPQVTDHGSLLTPLGNQALCEISPRFHMLTTERPPLLSPKPKDLYSLKQAAFGGFACQAL